MVWLGIVGALIALAYYVTRIAKSEEADSRQDTGLAILEFGRAFPQEAIRALHATADGNAIFVRLHDGKAGFMRNNRSHYACSLIRPGRVRVIPLPDAKGFSAEFLDLPSHNGNFLFGSETEAAEVSLWLLDNHVSIADRQAELAEEPVSLEPASESNP
ncbi:hypothetical protein EPK99_18435 [Neorhizobium lilium]|uniref:Uncharacterized protein n=1 Tax=Neorhizobium lilium TaxID=2503024 RepID=A0A444LE90_9HYPH|nr:hypothetical protein EPK99_18435 [Neorhizobium lilium]